MDLKRRWSRIIGFKNTEKQVINGPRISFDLIKVNSHGVRQQRTLMISEAGICNMKGKQCQWFYPNEDIYK